MSAPAIKVRGAVHRAGGRALVNGVDLDVWPGEVLAVVGPNGAGKSTLCALIAGDLRPHAGEVEICGQAVSRTSAPALARMRSLLPQHTPLNFPFMAREVVLMGRHPYLRRWRGPSDLDYAAADNALRRVGMLDMAERLYPTLSGGEQRRVSFARALAQDTPVALFDEPTASLDVGHQEMAMEERRRLAAEGKAVLAALHDLNLAGAHADRVAVMSDGEIVAVGETREALCGELLSAVFDRPLIVTPHPQTGCPVVLPAAGSERTDAAAWSVALRGAPIPTSPSGRGRRVAAGEGCRPRTGGDTESIATAVTQVARRT